MGAEHWIVRKPSGEEWGIIKRLIIDSTTRQITYADVILGETGRLIQVPWESFTVQKEWLILSMPEERAGTPVQGASRFVLGETVTMEVWP
ncbi:MAG: PRC-barrel domain-containing protein [Nitrospirae bacterium]|nr:PRC-barrel domain-containing protein [Nitrospirota bacterium]